MPVTLILRKKEYTVEGTITVKDALKQLGLSLAYYRKLKGLSQDQLAEAIGMSRTHISNIEAPNMPTSISLEALFTIAEVLGVEPAQLLELR